MIAKPMTVAAALGLALLSSGCGGGDTVALSRCGNAIVTAFGFSDPPKVGPLGDLCLSTAEFVRGWDEAGIEAGKEASLYVMCKPTGPAEYGVTLRSSSLCVDLKRICSIDWKDFGDVYDCVQMLQGSSSRIPPAATPGPEFDVDPAPPA